LYKEKFPTTQEADKIAQETIKANSKFSTKKTENNTIVKLAEGYQTLKNELQDRDAEIAMLRGLASIGISVATYTHELRSVMERLLPRTKMIKETLMKYIPIEMLNGVSKYDNPYYELDLMHSEDEKLYNWLRYSLNSIQRTKRDLKDIDLVSYLVNFVKAWKPALEKRNIDICVLNPDVEFAVIEGVEIDLDSIFNNFVANSVASLITTDEYHKYIQIDIKLDREFVIVDFIDNGHGLVEEYRNNPDVIFNAFETSVINKNGEKIGTGMGLFIVKGIIDKYLDADVSILNVQSGFGIRVIFRTKQNNI
jgi:signal transduction histidine kinase